MFGGLGVLSQQLRHELALLSNDWDGVPSIGEIPNSAVSWELLPHGEDGPRLLFLNVQNQIAMSRALQPRQRALVDEYQWAFWAAGALAVGAVGWWWMQRR